MASNPRPSFVQEIGPDGIAIESPIIAYTEKVIEEEQLQMKRYIQENYSKLRDVERELENLTLEMKLTAGPKRAAFEHMRKKIELVNERIRLAKLKEEETKKAWEVAAQVVKDEEAVKQTLCEDLNKLVQQSSNFQYPRLEELKSRLEALNPTRLSSDVSDSKSVQQPHSIVTASQQSIQQAAGLVGHMSPNLVVGSVNIAQSVSDDSNQQQVELREKKRATNLARGNKNFIPKSRAADSGWTGAGFDVDGRT